MSSISATSTASNLQMDFMKLLITQLQNQNPLEPLDNNEMASQLAQFSQLQELESINSNFAKVLTTAERNYANSLIGKEISYKLENQTGSGDVTNGILEEVYNNIDGQIILVVGNHPLGVEDIISVK